MSLDVTATIQALVAAEACSKQPSPQLLRTLIQALEESLARDKRLSPEDASKKGSTYGSALVIGTGTGAIDITTTATTRSLELRNDTELAAEPPLPTSLEAGLRLLPAVAQLYPDEAQAELVRGRIRELFEAHVGVEL